MSSVLLYAASRLSESSSELPFNKGQLINNFALLSKYNNWKIKNIPPSYFYNYAYIFPRMCISVLIAMINHMHKTLYE